MSDLGKKVIGFLSQLMLLPVYTITWVLGSPYLMTLLCIMSEVLVELVVSAIMAGVSLVVSAVILMEDDDRPLVNESAPKSIESNECDIKQKSTSTKSLEHVIAQRCAEKAKEKKEAAAAAALLAEEIEEKKSSMTKESSEMKSREGSKLSDLIKEGSLSSVAKSPRTSSGRVNSKGSAGLRSPTKEMSFEKGNN